MRARTGLQIRAPSGRHDAGVFEAHSLKLVRVHDRVSPGRQVARPTFTPRSDKRSHFEAGGRRKARAPAEYTTARPRASKRVEATRVGGRELVHGAVEGMRGRDTVQRGRAPPARGPRRPTSPRAGCPGLRRAGVTRRGVGAPSFRFARRGPGGDVTRGRAGPQGRLHPVARNGVDRSTHQSSFPRTWRINEKGTGRAIASADCLRVIRSGHVPPPVGGGI